MSTPFFLKKKKSLKRLLDDVSSSAASSGKMVVGVEMGRGDGASSSHARGRRQLIEEDVGVAAADLTGGHWRYPESRERERQRKREGEELTNMYAVLRHYGGATAATERRRRATSTRSFSAGWGW